MTCPEKISDYRIIRKMGRGGMGIVYEAEPVSLGRRVAPEVLPRDVVSTKRSLERFRREAKAAGRLHHTNIVPVFGVGEDVGLHYYVMRFIAGQSLEQILADLPRVAREQTNRLVRSVRKAERRYFRSSSLRTMEAML